MPEKNNELMVDNGLKGDLKARARVQVKAIANTCMQTIKVEVGEYAEYAIHRFFDFCIDCINAKLSA